MTNPIITIANAKDNNPYGITITQLNKADGTLHIMQHVTDITTCHYLNPHPNGKFLAATTTDGDCDVIMFAIDADNGHLSEINRQPAGGTSPAYVYVEDTGQQVLIVNYATGEARGNIRVYPINADGELQAPSTMIEHDGGSIDPERQQESHPHMIVTTPDNRFAVVPDLGTDKIYLYALDTKNGTLSLSQTLDLHAGAGPRHVAFHPTLQRMYIICELDSTLITYAYTDDDTWTHQDTRTTLPTDYSGESYCADVHVHPNGQFLYGSNRGHDSIVIFVLDEDGIPDVVGFESTRGHWPRAFMIDNDGEFLIVGNRREDNLAIFAIDAQSGLLTHKTTLDMPAPIGFKQLR